MYRCLPKRHDPSRLILFVLVFVAVISAFCLYRDRVDFHNSKKQIIIFAVFAVFVTLLFLSYLIKWIDYYLWGSAVFRLTDEGICIKKKLHKERIVLWKEIEDGRICYMFFSGRFNEPVPMFRFSLDKTKDETKGKKNVFLRHYPKMYDYRYYASNQKTVIAFYYDVDAEKEIRTHYPMLQNQSNQSQ